MPDGVAQTLKLAVHHGECLPLPPTTSPELLIAMAYEFAPRSVRPIRSKRFRAPSR